METTPYVGDFIDDDITEHVHIIADNKIQKYHQCVVYDEFYNNAKFEWCAFIDIDEFVYCKSHKNIKDYLHTFSNDVNVISLIWTIFGDDGKIYDDYSIPVRQRFLKQHIMKNKRYASKVICKKGIKNIH